MLTKKKKFIHQHERSAVWCPLKRRRVQLEVCGKWQQSHERQCRRADSGHCCQNVDDARIVSAFTVYEERKSSHA